MKIPNVTIQQLLEAGVHLGHKTLRWNPKMKKYIFGKRDSIHIIDLTQTLELTNVALEKVYNTIIPRNVRVSEAPSHGKPVLLYDLNCAGSQAYVQLASEMLRRHRVSRSEKTSTELSWSESTGETS